MDWGEIALGVKYRWDPPGTGDPSVGCGTIWKWRTSVCDIRVWIHGVHYSFDYFKEISLYVVVWDRKQESVRGIHVLEIYLLLWAALISDLVTLREPLLGSVCNPAFVASTFVVSKNTAYSIDFNLRNLWGFEFGRLFSEWVWKCTNLESVSFHF